MKHKRTEQIWSKPKLCTYQKIKRDYTENYALYNSSKKKKCFGHHLVVFPANPHNLLLSGGAGGPCVCLHVHMCTCACVWALVSSVCVAKI